MKINSQSPLVVLLSVLLTVGGCSSEHVPELTEKSTLATTASTPMVAGYVHDLSRSMFAYGTSAESVRTATLDRYVASEGVFAVDRINGGAIATPNATAHSWQALPYSGSATEHSARTVAYFVGAGLPQDQILSTYVTTRSYATKDDREPVFQSWSSAEGSPGLFLAGEFGLGGVS